MNLWKISSLVLAALLVLSAAGSIYFYGGLFGINVWQGVRTRSKIVTLLRTENMTNLNAQGWNVSVDVFGYTSGSLYCEVFQTGNRTGDFPTEWLSVRVLFETDGIVVPSQFHKEIYGVGTAVLDVSITGSRMWVSLFATYEWAVISMSLHSRA